MRCKEKPKKHVMYFNWDKFLPDFNLNKKDIASIYGVKGVSGVNEQIIESKITNIKKDKLEKYLSTNLDEYVIKDLSVFLRNL